MAKFTADDKLSAALRYLDGTESYESIATTLGTTESVVRNWVKQYEHNGVEAFRKSYTSYSAQFKLDVLNYMNHFGTSPNETAAIFQITSPALIRKWRIQFHSLGIDALQSKKKGRPTMKKETKKGIPVEGSVEALREEVERLRMENAYPKKVECLSSKQGKITKQDKAQVVFELRTEFPVKALLKLAGIPRSTYYYYVKMNSRPDKHAELKAVIQVIYHEHKGRYGYRRITHELRILGYLVNHKKVQRLMNKLGLKSIVRMKKYRSYKGKVGKTAPNLLNRDFHAEKPNEKWVTDITEFKLFGEKLYLSPMLDLYNGEIIAYTVDTRPRYSLVSKMLEQACRRLTATDRLMIHSDQGWHYQMNQYRQVLKDNNITQSMSRKGNCYDNAVMESFFGTLKSEFLYTQEFESVEQFKRELVKYIDYYNNKRIKTKLKGLSPVQYRTQTLRTA
ncbi:IS3 family transposase [Brevibacillus ruminantium]|uniref:IS3 family transposase n=1 Tax=Brevibacillus ruminantium TaxID=2950604 RepID=A0ABY4WJY8_9BACL|nr:IS3 family transposase [Brevibacillus ruminantium]USG67096.1 IS3 family transposase [Brevibacillus ruminantium]